ncbi:MAG: hypothetical protein ACM3ZT_09245 [Bacillota bacterium]
MDMKRALQVIFVIGLAGAVFSGTLTYREFSTQAAACTPVGQPGTLFGYPPCVYGLIMYSAVVFIAGWGLASKRPASRADTASR